jgi:hypothetical protein
VPEVRVLAPWRRGVCCGRCLRGRSMSAATGTVCQVSRAAPLLVGWGRLGDARRTGVGVVVLKQTARVAQVGCRQVFCERAVVVCLGLRVRLCSRARGKEGLLRRRKGVDRSEGDAGFARGTAHGLWRAWWRGRAVSCQVAGRVNPQLTCRRENVVHHVAPLGISLGLGAPRCRGNARERDAQLHLDTLSRDPPSASSGLLHCFSLIVEARQAKQCESGDPLMKLGTRQGLGALEQCVATRASSRCGMELRMPWWSFWKIKSVPPCVVVSRSCLTVRHEHNEALARQQAIDRADLPEAPTVLREATVDPPPAVSPASA